jgi:hypothetical protein
MLLRWIEIAAGLYYLVFGLDGFFKRIPLPSPSERGMAFLKALDEAKYVLFTVKVIEILVGLAWILGVASGLAWIVFTPILVNILAYHLLVNRKELGLPMILLVIHMLLAYKHWEILIRIFQESLG